MTAFDNITGDRNKLQGYIETIGCVVLVLLGLLSNVSDAGCRNAVRIILILSFVFVCVCPFVRQRLSISWRLVIGMMVLWLVIILSALRGGNFEKAMETSSITLGYTFLIVMAVPLLVNKEIWLHRIFVAIMLSLFANDIAVLLGAWHGELRPNGLLRYYADVAVVYVTCLPIIFLAMVNAEKRSHKWFLGLNFLVGWGALLFTNTRAAWLGAAIGCLVVGIFQRKVFNIKKTVAIIMATLFLLGAFVAVLPKEKNRVYSVVRIFSETNVEQNPEKARIMLWNAGLHAFMEKPLTGIGWYNFKDYNKEFNKQLYTKKQLEKKSKYVHVHAHSNYIHLAAENGIVAILVFVWLNIYLLWLGWQKRKSVYGVMLLAIVASFSFFGMTLYVLNQFEGMRVFYLCLGLCLAGLRIGDSRDGEKLRA